jgi:hypothetical protein
LFTVACGHKNLQHLLSIAFETATYGLTYQFKKKKSPPFTEMNFSESQSLPAEDFLEPFRTERRKDK